MMSSVRPRLSIVRVIYTKNDFYTNWPRAAVSCRVALKTDRYGGPEVTETATAAAFRRMGTTRDRCA